MSYNLILNSKLESEHNWKFINCKLENGILTSSKKVFGMEQELVLPNLSRLYFRVKYKTFCNIKEIKIGIQNNNELEVNTQVPRLNKLQSISITDAAQQNKIKLHIIFESENDVNRVMVQEPLLVDLNHLNRSTWMKSILDLITKYRTGYNYTNEYPTGEITSKLKDFQDIVVDDGKVGVIVKTKTNIEIPLSVKFVNGHYYLVKVHYNEINRFGQTLIKYGIIKSRKIVEDQAYLTFKANDLDSLILSIESNDVLDYKVNLQHMLITDITKMNLLKEDIPYLPFV